MSVIPSRSEEIATWEVRGKDWCETVKIRIIGHESAFPTGAFPAAFGADRRCVSCPDNFEAYFTEAAFAVDIARALHAVKQHAAKETPTLNATTALKPAPSHHQALQMRPRSQSAGNEGGRTQRSSQKNHHSSPNALSLAERLKSANEHL